MLRVGEIGEDRAPAAREVGRGRSRALCKGRCALQHPLVQLEGYLGARRMAFGRRAVHDDADDDDDGKRRCTAVRKPRRCRYATRRMEEEDGRRRRCIAMAHIWWCRRVWTSWVGSDDASAYHSTRYVIARSLQTNLHYWQPYLSSLMQ